MEQTAPVRQTRSKPHKLNASSEAEIKSALLDALLSPMATGKLRQRQMVVRLIPVIEAMRTVGIEFEEIASILRTKGMTITGGTLSVYFYQERKKEEETNLASQAEMYKRMAEKVMDTFNGAIGLNTEAAVERALEKAARLADEKRHTKGGSEQPTSAPIAKVKPGSGTPPNSSPDEVANVGAGAKTKRAGAGVTRPIPADKVGRGRTSEGAENKSLTIEEVNAIFAEHIDLSQIPRRVRPE